jgi:putative hemolysin
LVETAAADPGIAPARYDARRLSYAHSFEDRRRAAIIRGMEWLTGKPALVRRIRAFERAGVPEGQAFWERALAHMRIALEIAPESLRRIPTRGPLVVVSNHPHGLVDGMVLAALVGRVRDDYKILVRSLLTGIPQIERFLIPVPFPHEAQARGKGLEMRRRAMAQLAAGGAVILFPSGSVAASPTLLGAAVEAPWAPFTANLIQRTGATVVPVFFPGGNSRAYLIAARLSPTLRQGMLLHEVVQALDRPQSPVVGEPIHADCLADIEGGPRALVAHLRKEVLALGR